MNSIKSYNSILQSKGSDYISYSEKLNTIEWHNFRTLIIKRDGNKCTLCLKRPNELAWWNSPEVYIRWPDEEELKFLDDNIIYESEHTIMHVHHKFYIKNHLPWEYDLEALVTVCADCHKNIHINSDVFMFDNTLFDNPVILYPCEKCSGTGYLPYYHYYQGGICFQCNGNRFFKK